MLQAVLALAFCSCAVVFFSQPMFDPRDDSAEDDERIAARLDDEARDALDEAFPLGDGVADTTATVWCPYCGEPNEIGVDPGGGAAQEYVEDCAVCCRPWRVMVAYGADGTARVSVGTADE